MRIVVIGGTGFIGGAAVEQLQQRGHELLLFHRGRKSQTVGAISDPQSSIPTSVGGQRPPVQKTIHADRQCLADFRIEFAQFQADIVLDTILSSARQAESLIATFKGITGRIVALSSMDAYRACGVLHRTEPGPPDPMPLTEESPLRTRPAYPPAQVRMLKSIFEWLDDEYDKVSVERVIMSDPQIPGTVLRLPMVYGPADPLHRFFPVLKRINDGRPAIILDENVAQWRGTRGYVKNVAAAIAAAVESGNARGRIYNVGEPYAFSEEEWTGKIAEASRWNGRIVTLPSDRTPAHLQFPGNTAQHWIADTSRIRRELGYREIVPLDEAIARTIEWERANPPAQIDPAQYDYVTEDRALSGGT